MKVARILLTVCLVAVLASVAKAELIVHYQFDNASNLALDSSGNNKTAVLATSNNPPTYSNEGIIGGAAEFDGTQGYMVENYIFPYSGFTFAAWVKPATISPMVVRTNAATSGFTVSMASTEFRFWTMHSAGLYNTWVGGGVAPKLNQWQHIAMTYEPDGDRDENGDFTGTIRVYMDGVHTNTLAGAKYCPTTWADLNIGYNSAATNYMGAIDDLRVYDEVLSGEDISILVENIPPQPISAIAYYSFDDPNSLPHGMGTDDSGSGFNLNKYDTNTNEPDFIDEGYFGGAAKFNGTNQGLRSPDGIFNSSAFSFTAWVKPGAYSPVIARTFSSWRGFSTSMVSSEFRYWGLYTDEANTAKSNWLGGLVSPKLNQWQHIAMTFEPVTDYGNYVEGIFKVYHNGIETNRNENFKYSYGVSASLCVGRYGGSSYYNGVIDEVAVFDKALTAEQITAIATGEVSPLRVPVIENKSDLNKDGITNLLDYAEFSTQWLQGSY